MKKTQIVILIIVTALMAGGAYWYVGVYLKQEPTVSMQATPNAETAAFQVLAAQLKSVTLNTELFDMPTFKYLVDTSVTVLEEPHHRADPFAPVPGVARQ